MAEGSMKEIIIREEGNERETTRFCDAGRAIIVENGRVLTEYLKTIEENI